MSQETNFSYRVLDMLLKTLQMTLKERLNVVIFVMSLTRNVLRTS